jgi:hypothetical protein
MPRYAVAAGLLAPLFLTVAAPAAPLAAQARGSIAATVTVVPARPLVGLQPVTPSSGADWRFIALHPGVRMRVDTLSAPSAADPTVSPDHPQAVRLAPRPARSPVTMATPVATDAVRGAPRYVRVTLAFVDR